MTYGPAAGTMNSRLVQMFISDQALDFAHSRSNQESTREIKAHSQGEISIHDKRMGSLVASDVSLTDFQEGMPTHSAGDFGGRRAKAKTGEGG